MTKHIHVCCYTSTGIPQNEIMRRRLGLVEWMELSRLGYSPVYKMLRLEWRENGRAIYTVNVLPQGQR
jgi:hypothetical protein